MQNIIEINNLTKIFNPKSKISTKALDNINLVINQHEVVGLIGPNGAGKTTMLRILLGLEKQSDGEVKIFGKNTNDLDVKQRIAYQADLQFAARDMNVYDFLVLNSALLGNDNNEDQILWLLEYFHLTNSYKKPLTSLSRGMRQKVELVNAFLNKPELVLLDEPTAALDPPSVLELRDFINSRRGKDQTILFSSHHISEVEKVCDRVILISNGTIFDDVYIKNIENGYLEEKFVKMAERRLQ